MKKNRIELNWQFIWTCYIQGLIQTIVGVSIRFSEPNLGLSPKYDFLETKTIAS